MDEQQAQAIADILGGETWNTGGGICLVVKKRSDGRVVAISDESVCEYENQQALDQGKPSVSIVLC